MNEVELRKAQHCQVIIAKEIKRICNQYGIKYFIAYGSALGAVRHKGFIPWDDDMDICMLRNDYNLFISVCKQALSDSFFLQTFDTDPYYGWPFAKILMNGTRYKEEWAAPKAKDGVYIDVFPLDKATSDREKAHRDYFVFRKTLRMLQIKQGYTGFLEKKFLDRILKNILKIESNFYTKEQLEEKLNKILTKYDDTDSSLVHNLNSPYSDEKETMPEELFENLIEADFESERFAIPKNYNVYLTHIYGDYMKLPPENERKNRHKIKTFYIPDDV